MRRLRKQTPLIARSVTNENFIHVVRMFPLMRMWAVGLQEGAEVDLNAINMAQMPVEIAEALIRERALVIDAVGTACRDVVAAIDGGIRGITALHSKAR